MKCGRLFVPFYDKLKRTFFLGHLSRKIIAKSWHMKRCVWDHRGDTPYKANDFDHGMKRDAVSQIVTV